MFSSLNIRIGLFLASRAIRRASLWTTSLIIFVMVLTFLNLVVVSGILVGLIQGAFEAARTEFTSDVIISTLDDKKYIENSPNLIALLNSMAEVESISPRYSEGAVVEANYKTRNDTEKPNTAGTQLLGIDPVSEHTVTGLGDKIFEGEYLRDGDYDQVILGYYLLSQYVPFEDPNFAALKNVGVGDKIRIKFGDIVREVTVKGIIKSKVDALTRNVFMVDSQVRSMIGRNDGNVDQIAVKLAPGADPIAVREALKLRGVDGYARVQTFADAQPQFLKDIINTFNMLGTAFSSIGLVVSSITIFIVIFINALTGSAIGLGLVYLVLVPAIAAHPIDFPFSDGILVAEVGDTMFRVGLLVFSTVIAGYIPAWMIVRKNTLDSILGRN